MPDVHRAYNALDDYAFIRQQLDMLYVALDDLEDILEDEHDWLMLGFPF